MADIDALVDDMADTLTQQPGSHGFGKFSLYFVLFSTIFVVGLFLYALMRLIRECRKKHALEGDFYCPAPNEDDIDVRYRVLEGADPHLHD